jgi:CheY-like chemotaxis protein
MPDLRVAVIDDDPWRRAGISGALRDVERIRARRPDLTVHVVLDASHIEAIEWPRERWADVHVALIDARDESAAFEQGTDMYEGIEVLALLRGQETKTVVMVDRPLPVLLRQRLVEYRATCVFARTELDTFETLIEVIADPPRDRAPLPPTPAQLRRRGVLNGNLGEALRLYRRSKLYGLLHPGLRHQDAEEAIGSRRAVDSFTNAVQERAHLKPSTDRPVKSGKLRFPAVRDLLLKLLGRQDD